MEGMYKATDELDSTVEILMEQLLAEGRTKEDAWVFIADKHKEAIDLKDQMLSYGYDEKESYYVAAQKLRESLNNLGIEHIRYGRITPLRVINDCLEGGLGWYDMNDKQKGYVLWELGFDTRRYKWFVNAGCINYSGTPECGIYIQGTERSDFRWKERKVDDKNVASDEIRFGSDWKVLSELRGNKKA